MLHYLRRNPARLLVLMAGNNDISCVFSPGQTAIPATGPVDFNGDGNTTDTWRGSGCTSTGIDLDNDGAGGHASERFPLRDLCPRTLGENRHAMHLVVFRFRGGRRGLPLSGLVSSKEAE